ncbi:MAG: hypothetical protein Q8M19_17070 [Reyranella sp.]|nr:hypothetical protein [Reyranella sp.]
MTTVNELVFGIPDRPQPQRIEALSWAEAAHYKRIHRENVRLPAHMAHMTLAELEAKADEEYRPQREALEAEQSARRIAAAPDAIRRALEGAPKRRTPGRIRACFLRQLLRWGTISQAAAAVGVDVRTIQRWRAKLPAFDERCVAALGQRAQMLEDDGIARARTRTVRPLFFAGKKVGEVESYDNRMLVHMLNQVKAQAARSAKPAPAPAPVPAPVLDPAAFATALGGVLAPLLRAEMARVLEEVRRPEMSGGAGQAESDPFPML